MADSDNLRTKVKEDVIRIMAETLEISPDEILGGFCAQKSIQSNI